MNAIAPLSQEAVFTPVLELVEDESPINTKPLLELPGDDSPLSTFAEKLGGILGKQGVYLRGDIAITITQCKCTPVDITAMPSFVEQFAVTYKMREKGGVRFQVVHSMSTSTARSTFSAPQFLKKLKELKYVAPVQMPQLRKSGVIELRPHGYDEESGIFTNPDSPEFPTDMERPEAVLFIDELLVEFPFVEDGGRSKSVVIASMLTVFAEGILEPLAQKPVFIYLANSEGSGKTLLAMLAGVPYGGVTVTSPPTNEGEWKKTLLAFVISGSRVVIYDNVKGHLDSPSLEGYLTSTKYEGRILGHSRIYSGESGAVVMITGNGLTVTPDLRRRSLFVELFSEELRAENKVFKKTLDQAELLRLRPKILGALYSMVRSWNEAGRPDGKVDHASATRWAKVIGGIMENAGYTNPCIRPDIDSMGDTNATDLESLTTLMTPNRRYEFSEIAAICVREGFFEHAIVEIDGENLTRKGNAILGRTLQRFDRKIVGATARFEIQGKGHHRRYSLEEAKHHVDHAEHGQHGQHGPQAPRTLKTTEPLTGLIPPELFTSTPTEIIQSSVQEQSSQNPVTTTTPQPTKSRPRLSSPLTFNANNL